MMLFRRPVPLSLPSFLLPLVLLSGSAGAASTGPTQTTLAVSASGKATTFAAHVTSSAGTPVTQGSVSFAAGFASLGSAVLDGTGQAQVTVTSLPKPVDGASVPVTAIFHPAASAQLSESTSSPQAVHSNATGIADFAVAGSPTTLTEAEGSYASSVITVTPLNGYDAQVTLSCIGLPAQTTCTFSPVIDSTANGAFTSTLQVQTQGGAGPSAQLLGGGTLAWGLLVPFGLLGLAGARRRRGRGLWMAVGCTALLAGAAGLGGCSDRYGYNHHPPSEPGGSGTGTYSITVQASGNTGSDVTVHSLALTLEVQ